ncbi:bifunctional hydroxymethylpyrimidine kinase/phosphomethylpyrimidine kinase [Methanosphaera cuniculi]|uniref:bifunctional hydroxymethylpyrimidine kinase/phosphomethylpyrimidine kinase n=1 Tax=Methanosphaera cuniculi TaxID=1077256 RepID=UPI0026ECFC5F|nr:bifunctional hydroxymethylpyrimidine kinase/phosphomethylpyrimidine kinase [Methanosphaera cuniculi]
MYIENKFKEEKPCSMTIAGLDPSAGAGLLADLKTFQAHNIYATCVCSTLTAQNPFEVKNVKKVDPSFIADEIDMIMDVYPIKYIKTGVLYANDIIKMVNKKVVEYDLSVIVDPVMISESGCDLSGDNFADNLKENLLKNAYLTTPNIHEAEQLTNMKIETEDDMINAALKLNKYCNCVITGGHLYGNDILCVDGEITKIKGNMIKSDNTHGTGCNYSAAITSNLIHKKSLKQSCHDANKYIQKSIMNGFYNTPYQF